MPKKTIAVSGTIEALNFSPKGPYEGVLVKTSTGLIQINFPKEHSSAIAEIAVAGNDIELRADPEVADERAAHLVYRLISLKDGEKAWPSDDLAADRDVSFTGKIARLNYALHGEANGAVLENGDFIHTKPHGAKATKLKPGMKIKGIGRIKAVSGGFRVIEATEVNGLNLHTKSENGHH